jgi:biotin operon repressor
MIDRIREDIEQRLEQLLAEADKLRDALSALGPGDGNGHATSGRSSRSTGRGRGAGGTGAGSRSASGGRARRGRPPGRAAAASTRSGGGESGGRTRTASGATRQAVLEALTKAQGEPLTAGQVASSTGLGRPSVSTTLSKLARSGDVIKAQRGYAIAAGGQKPSG